MIFLNTVCISGRLAKDPVVKETMEGNLLLCFTVVQEFKGHPLKEMVRDPDYRYPMYFDCTLHGKPVETLQYMLYKSVPVFLQGQLRQRSYVDKAGIKRFAVYIRCDKVVVQPQENSKSVGYSHGSTYGSTDPEAYIERSASAADYGAYRGQNSSWKNQNESLTSQKAATTANQDRTYYATDRDW